MKHFLLFAALLWIGACRVQPSAPSAYYMDKHTALNEIGRIVKNADSNGPALQAIKLCAYSADHNLHALVQITGLTAEFGYHTAVLTELAVIVAQTDYECPYYGEIAGLAVRSLSSSDRVIAVAKQARDARSSWDFIRLKSAIQEIDDACELRSLEEARAYNRKIISRE